MSHGIGHNCRGGQARTTSGDFSELVFGKGGWRTNGYTRTAFRTNGYTSAHIEKHPHFVYVARDFTSDFSIMICVFCPAIGWWMCLITYVLCHYFFFFLMKCTGVLQDQCCLVKCFFFFLSSAPLQALRPLLLRQVLQQEGGAAAHVLRGPREAVCRVRPGLSEGGRVLRQAAEGAGGRWALRVLAAQRALCWGGGGLTACRPSPPAFTQ